MPSSRKMGQAFRAELASQEAADPEAVQEVLNRFSGSTPGLELPKFARVRLAIQGWLDDLAPATIEDISAAVEVAKQEFTLVTHEDAQAAKAKQ